MIINESNYLSKVDKYVQYVIDHRSRVRRAYETYLKKYCTPDEQVKLDYRMKVHDLDKLNIADGTFDIRVDYYHPSGNQAQNISIPLPTETAEFAQASELHKKSNPHHWEYWLVGEEDIPTEMSKISLIEMLADWSSFQFIKNAKGNAHTWYAAHKDEIKLHPKTRKELQRYLDLIPSL